MISFVVTARDEQPAALARTVAGVLDSLSAEKRDVIVVDDGSRRPVEGLPREVRLVRSAVPLGATGARRRGCELARGDVLVVMDAHLTFGEGWLSALMEAAAPGAIVCGSYWDYERVQYASFGADLTLEKARDYASGRSPGFQVIPRTWQPLPETHEVPAILGGCYMMTRETYDGLGGFCPLFRTWGVDEQDLSLRTWMSGGRVLCVPDAKIGHLTRSSFPYPVSFDDVEFNQLVMIRSIFDFRLVRAIEAYFDPLSDSVRHALASVDLGPWRRHIQRNRQWSDLDIIQRLVPDAAGLLG